MSKVVIKTISLVAVLLFVVALVPAGDVFAQADKVRDGIDAAGGSGAQPLSSVIKTVVNLLLYFIGALSVIMIIFGGFKYVTSAGDTSGVASAKNTIMYAVIGLIIAALAFSIVNFAAGIFDAPTQDSNLNPSNGGTNAADQVSPPSSGGSGNIGGDASDINKLIQDGSTQNPGTGAASGISPGAPTGSGSIGGDG